MHKCDARRHGLLSSTAPGTITPLIVLPPDLVHLVLQTLMRCARCSNLLPRAYLIGASRRTSCLCVPLRFVTCETLQNGGKRKRYSAPQHRSCTAPSHFFAPFRRKTCAQHLDQSWHFHDSMGETMERRVVALDTDSEWKRKVTTEH